MAGLSINTHLKDDGTLLIFYGNQLLAEVSNGRNDEGFVEEILNGMGYAWNEDGSINKI